MYEKITSWENLLAASKRAEKRKKSKPQVGQFRYNHAANLLQIQVELREQSYAPQPYRRFLVFESKQRQISAAAYRDRVVHHALCRIIEPEFDKHFIGNSFANRQGKGTHKAIDRFYGYAGRYTYCLRMDLQRYFQSIDHRLLKENLAKVLRCEKTQWLVNTIIDSGVDAQFGQAMLFDGDNLSDFGRACGLPIGNFTSQLWANCYLHPLDLYICRSLKAPAYLRYVDDFAIFSNNKAQLHDCRNAIIERLQLLRLRMHESSAQVTPCSHGLPWLGMVIYPDKKKLKARKARYATKKLKTKFRQWRAGEISFAMLQVSINAWVAHAKHADTDGLIEHVLNIEMQK